MSIRLIHISDLHFDVRAGTTSSRRHSFDYLEGIASLIKTQEFDRLIVSGDITNSGDTDSLKHARDYITDSIPKPNGGRVGLGLGGFDKVVIIPGNHDAFNSSGLKAPYQSIMEAWQRSTTNFDAIFLEKPLPKPFGCNYDWVNVNGTPLYICYVNSCHLGDSGAPNIFQFFRHVARGDVSIKQTDRIKDFYFRGQRGVLRVPDRSSEIPREDFSAAFKILVMHHYLVPPPGLRVEPMMRLRQQREVFMRLALCDFDVMLCGHSHVPHMHEREYSVHFSRRSRRRFQRAYAGRIFGTENFPRVLGPREERFALSDWSSFALNCFIKYELVSATSDEIATTAAAIDNLRKALGSESAFKTSLRRVLANLADTGEMEVDREQLRRIHRRVIGTLTNGERVGFARLSKGLPALIRATRNRSFVQMSCGSSAKASSTFSPRRSIYIYDIDQSNNSWTLNRTEYLWDAQQSQFVASAKAPRTAVFGRSRRPVST